MILPHQYIKHLCNNAKPLIDPCVDKTVFKGMTYGLSEAGIDIRIKQNLTVYPKTFKYLMFNTLGFWCPSFCLASSQERFILPNDIMAQVCDKSSWARQGLFVQNTWLEPGWCGYLTLELTNDSNKKIKLTSGQPIAQVIFHKLLAATEQPYVGKYQNQVDNPVATIYEK